MFKHTGRAFAAILSLVVALVGATLVGHVQARRNAEELVSKFSLGVATIGDGEASSGIYNTNASDFGGDVRKALDVAVHQVSKIRFLRGTYAFAHPWKSGRSDIEITADPGAKFSVDGDDAVGLFDLSGDRVVLSDLYVSLDGWTDSQAVVKLSGKFQRIARSTFEVTTTAGNTSTPTNLIATANAVEPTIDHCTFLPGKGARILDIDHGNGFTFDDNLVRNTSVMGLGGSGESISAQTRACWQVIRGIGAQYGSVRRNRIWALGTQTTGELTDVMLFQRDHDGIADDQGSPGTVNGLICIESNQIYEVASPCYIRFRGVAEYTINHNMFGPSLGVMDAAGEAAIVLDNEASQSLGNETGITGSGTIDANVFNNCAATGSAASQIYVFRSKKQLISNNVFHLSNSKQSIMVNVDDSSTTLIEGNYFDGDEANSLWGVAFESPGTTYTVRCISIRNNMFEGLLRGLCPGRIGDDLTQYGTGTTYDDGGIIFGSSGTIFPGKESVIVDSAARTAAALTYPPTASPTFETVPDCSGSYANVNKAVVVLADKIARLAGGSGAAVAPLTISITGNDTSTPTTLEACTTLQTEENAIYDLATLVNAAIGQSLSPRARRIRYLATIVGDVGAADVGGVSTSDAFGAITDNSGGTPVASIPQVTNDATAASAIKLLATAFDRYERNLQIQSNFGVATTAGF